MPVEAINETTVLEDGVTGGEATPAAQSGEAAPEQLRSATGEVEATVKAAPNPIAPTPKEALWSAGSFIVLFVIDNCNIETCLNKCKLILEFNLISSIIVVFFLTMSPPLNEAGFEGFLGFTLFGERRLGLAASHRINRLFGIHRKDDC
jgi:hypothetical protein